jgi:hypothetical protein
MCGPSRPVEGGVCGGAGGRQRSAGALDVFATLSTAANSEVNKEATIKIGISSGVSLRGSVGLIGYVLDLADMSHISLPVPQARSFIVSSGRDEKKRTDVEWLKFNVNPPL